VRRGTRGFDEVSMALLLTPIFGSADEWRSLFAQAMPALDLRLWPDAGNPADIEVAAVAMIPPGKLQTFPNLKLIVSLTAGAEGLLADRDLPDVPVVRASDLDGDAMMNEAALLHVLRHHRHLPAYAAAQQRCEWISLPRLRADQRKVGVMGLGAIGLSAARALARHGFKVAGWVRSPRTLEDIEVFAGRAALPAFLARSEIVVNFLPLTAETEGILDAQAFAQMPKGAAIVNLGRGAHVVDADLMAALDSGHLAGATLDVFRIEPLPKDSPLWRHPKITVIPHASRRIAPSDLVPRIVEAMRRLKAGEPQRFPVDRARGY
jgi:glyoxylate/hydroxypyruvate reductase A